MTFENLMKGLSLLSQKATREQKLMLSFYLLDPKGTGVITKKMTTELLRSCLDECNGEGPGPFPLFVAWLGERHYSKCVDVGGLLLC